MSSRREDLIQAVRDFLMVAAADTPLTDEQVRKQPVGGPRPELPYLTVHVTAHDIDLGVGDEVRWDLDEDSAPTESFRSAKAAVVSIQGFGTGADAWMERARENLWSEAVEAILDAAGFTLEPRGGIQVLFKGLESKVETRFLQEYDVAYAVTSSLKTLVAATSLRTETTFTGSGGALHETVDTDLT